MSDSAPERRPLAVVASPTALQALRGHVLLRGEDLTVAADFRRPDFGLKPILWVAAEAIRKPAWDENSQGPPPRSFREEVQDWEKLIHLVHTRQYVYLAVVHNEDDWAQFNSYMAEVIKPAIQAHVRNDGRGPILVLIFEWDSPADQLQLKLARAAEDFRIYLMEPQLNVSAVEGRLVHSRHVWPAAVERLLLRLHCRPVDNTRGVWAWRSWRWVCSAENDEVGKLAQRKWSEFREWFLNSSHSPPDAATVGPLDRLKRQAEIKLEIPQSSPPPISFEQLEVSSTPLSETWDIQLALERYEENLAGTKADAVTKTVNFSPGAAVQAMEEATDARKLVELVKKWANTLRGEIAGGVAGLVEKRKNHRAQFRGVRETPPPEGGAGIYQRVAMASDKQLETLHMGQLYEAQARELGALSTATEQLNRDRIALVDQARELQRARDHFLNDTTRVILGLVVAVLLGFVVAQAVSIWSGLWLSGGSLWRLPLREFAIVVVWLGAGLVGVILGIALPRYLELRRGKQAAQALESATQKFLEEARAKLRENAVLCRVAAGPEGLSHAAEEWGRARRNAMLAGHGHRTVRSHLPESLGVAGETAAPLPAGPEVLRPGREAAWDLRAFHQTCTAELPRPEKPLSLPAEAEQKKVVARERLEEFYKEIFIRDWQEVLGDDRLLDRGWLCSAAVADAMAAMARRITDNATDERMENLRQAQWEGVTDDQPGINAARQRWFDNDRKITPMLTASFTRTEGVVKKVSLFTRFKGDLQVRLEELYEKSGSGRQIQPDDRCILPSELPPQIMADIFEEHDITAKFSPTFSSNPAGSMVGSAREGVLGGRLS